MANPGNVKWQAWRALGDKPQWLAKSHNGGFELLLSNPLWSPWFPLPFEILISQLITIHKLQSLPKGKFCSGVVPEPCHPLSSWNQTESVLQRQDPGHFPKEMFPEKPKTTLHKNQNYDLCPGTFTLERAVFLASLSSLSNCFPVWYSAKQMGGDTSPAPGKLPRGFCHVNANHKWK